MSGEDMKGTYTPLLQSLANRDPLPNALFSWHQWLYIVVPLYIVVGAVLAVLLPPIAVALYVGLSFLNLLLFVAVAVFARNRLQIFFLQHPRNLLSRAWLPLIAVLEGQFANLPSYLCDLRLKYGKNFCCAGQVVMSDFADIEKAMTSGQVRIATLGTSPLLPSRLPGLDVGPRNIFLLTLDDTEENSDHHAFRKCMVDTVMAGEDAKARQSDATAEALFDTLVKDYRRLVLDAPGADSNKTFFVSSTEGFLGFWIKYCHYILLALSPSDKAAQDVLQGLFNTDVNVFNYECPQGYWKCCDKVAEVEAVVGLYEKSPTLSVFKENCPAYHCMTRAELARLLSAIIRIAAITGVEQLAKSTMGFLKFPHYSGTETEKIDVLPIWDKLPLEDPDVVRRYILEIIRLHPPVSASSRVATEEFTVSMSGVDRTFPAGTKLLIPQGMAMLDPEVWGPTTFTIDVERSKLETHFAGFNAIGERSAGRQCPGQTFVLETMIKVLQLLGHERRRQ